jgi:hypothetical protein
MSARVKLLLRPAVVAKEQVPPLLSRCVHDLLAGFCYRRKIFQPLEWPASINNRPRVKPFLGRMNDRVQGAAPTAPYDVDI